MKRLDPIRSRTFTRMQAEADYGTNAASSFSRSSTIPTRNDTRLVTSYGFNSQGEMFQSVDPKGTETRQEFDQAGRQTKLIENYVDSGTNPDQNRTTEMTYSPDGQMKTLTATNNVTGDQVTTWVYGTTLAESDVARSDLVRAKVYPDYPDSSEQNNQFCGPPPTNPCKGGDPENCSENICKGCCLTLGAGAGKACPKGVPGIVCAMAATALFLTCMADCRSCPNP